MNDIMLGLQILLKYSPNGTCSAEHDVLYADGPEDISDEDKKTLNGLHWHWDNELSCWRGFT